MERYNVYGDVEDDQDEFEASQVPGSLTSRGGNEAEEFHNSADVGGEVDGDDSINADQAWAVVNSYFDEKGLVRQQLDSFDEFVNNGMQEIIDDSPDIEVKTNLQYVPGVRSRPTVHTISFGQMYMSKPTIRESDGRTAILYPHEARLRNSVYDAPLYVDVKYQRKLNHDEDDEGIDNDDEDDALNDSDNYNATQREYIGQIPIMLRSQFCVLRNLKDAELAELGECIFDQGGYFIINGSEKVLVAQERLANNSVFCFRKTPPSKFSWSAEVRSHVETGARPTSTMYVQMYAGSSLKESSSGGGQVCK